MIGINIGDKAPAGFNEPIEMLKDCHRRIEHFLDVLRTVECRFGGAELDDEGRRALKASLNYFANFAPRHTADEEQSLFPRVRANSGTEAADVMEQMERLEHEHRRCDEGHALVDQLASQWLETGRLGAAQRQRLRSALDELTNVYAAHIHVEEQQVFPVASKILQPEQVQQIGNEMRERRSLTCSHSAMAEPFGKHG